jgi:hypothetical protein
MHLLALQLPAQRESFPLLQRHHDELAPSIVCVATAHSGRCSQQHPTRPGSYFCTMAGLRSQTHAAPVHFAENPVVPPPYASQQATHLPYQHTLQ